MHAGADNDLSPSGARFEPSDASGPTQSVLTRPKLASESWLTVVAASFDDPGATELVGWGKDGREVMRVPCTSPDAEATFSRFLSEHGTVDAVWCGVRDGAPVHRGLDLEHAERVRRLMGLPGLPALNWAEASWRWPSGTVVFESADTAGFLTVPLTNEALFHEVVAHCSSWYVRDRDEVVAMGKYAFYDEMH